MKPALNDREQEILHLLLKEMTSIEISKKLFISVKTVEHYRMKLLYKAGAKNVVGLVLWAIKNGYHTLKK